MQDGGIISFGAAAGYFPFVREPALSGGALDEKKLFRVGTGEDEGVEGEVGVSWIAGEEGGERNGERRECRRDVNLNGLGCGGGHGVPAGMVDDLFEEVSKALRKGKR